MPLSDITTKCDAELATYQISKPKSESNVSEQKHMFVSCGYCVSDFITKCDAGVAYYQISKAESGMMPLKNEQMLEGRCVLGYCVSDIITNCDAGLAKNQISKAKNETMPWRKKQMREGRCALWKRMGMFPFNFAISTVLFSRENHDVMVYGTASGFHRVDSR